MAGGCWQLFGPVPEPAPTAPPLLPTHFFAACTAGFPFVFKACGLGLAVLLVLVTLIAAELSMRLLLMSSQLTGKRSYEELARHAYGRGGHLAVQCSLVAMNVGSVVSYLLILTDTVSSVAGVGAGGAGEAAALAPAAAALQRAGGLAPSRQWQARPPPLSPTCPWKQSCA